MFDYSTTELQTIDEALEPKLAWATSRQAHCEQMALDASRLLSCVEGRLQDYSGQGFFKRCWFSLSGKNGSIERANHNDLLEMQKYAWRYINLLQEKNLLLAHSVITVKNNLLTLSIEQNDIKDEITRLANKIYDRFINLESRVGKIEAAQNIHGWLLTLDTYDYDEKFSPNLRLLRVVSDFHAHKSSDWNITEIRYLQKALKEVGLNTKSSLTISDFIDGVIDEIEESSFHNFSSMLTSDDDIILEDKFIIDAISAPSFSSLYHIKENYTTSSRVIKTIQKRMNISHSEAMKDTLHSFIEEHGIDTKISVPLKDLAIEILGCISLAQKLSTVEREAKREPSIKESEITSNQVSSAPLANRLTSHPTEPSDPEELFQKGLQFSLEENPEYDPIQAVLWFRKAGEQGHAEAQYRLGVAYEKEIGIAQDPIKSSEWYRMAANQGHAAAQYELAICYKAGFGVKQDLREHINLLNLAAEQGFCDAQFNLGVAHQEGIEGLIPKSADQALNWYLKAANEGHSDAQNNLGALYGSQSIHGQAAFWFRKAAQQRHNLGIRNYFLTILEEFSINDCQIGFVSGRKYENAQQNFILNSEEIIFLLIDTTLFGGNGDGIAAGIKGLYWKNSFEEMNRIKWKDIKKSDINIVSPDKIKINQKELSLVGSNNKSDVFSRALLKIIEEIESLGFIDNV